MKSFSLKLFCWYEERTTDKMFGLISCGSVHAGFKIILTFQRQASGQWRPSQRWQKHSSWRGTDPPPLIGGTAKQTRKRARHQSSYYTILFQNIEKSGALVSDNRKNVPVFPSSGYWKTKLKSWVSLLSSWNKRQPQSETERTWVGYHCQTAKSFLFINSWFHFNEWPIFESLPMKIDRLLLF